MDGPEATLLSEQQRRLLRFRNLALSGSCAEWAKENAAWFAPRRPDHRQPPQVLSLVSAFRGDSRPFAVAEILGSRVSAMLDTGATMSRVNGRLARQAMEKVEPIRKAQVSYLTGNKAAVLARLDHIRLGRADFFHPMARISSVSWADSGEEAPGEIGNLLGMNLLLKFDAVCIDWNGSRVHLGELGPCEGGHKGSRQWLTGSLGIGIQAKISSDDFVLWADIDTGPPTTYCSEWLMEQIPGGEVFSFGSYQALAGKCKYNPSVFFNNQERGAESHGKHILIGMDVLDQFSAFGWQLNPLKMYFVSMPSGPGGPGI